MLVEFIRRADFGETGIWKVGGMKALVLQDWWNLLVTDMPDPLIKDDEVLLEVLATGICGSDVHGFTGETGRRRHGQVMGHETVGRVVGIGSGVGVTDGLVLGALATVNPVIGCGSCPECAAGEEQTCAKRRVIGVEPSIQSAFAQLMAVPGANVVVLNESMPPELGALVEPLAVGYHAARRGHVHPGNAVLVIGGGPIGQASALGARREGASRIVVSEPNATRRELNTLLGFENVDPAAVEDLRGSVVELMGRVPDVVIDAVGTTKSLADSLTCSGPASAIVLVGMGATKVELPAYEISTKERSIVGSFCYSNGEFRATAEWVKSVPPELSLLIDGRVNIFDAPSAFTALARGELDASKVIVLLNALEGEPIGAANGREP